MKTSDLNSFFEERFSEIEAYLELLHDIERAARSGAPRIERSNSVISAPQQKILYSSVYLQLYNLVEATVSICVRAVADAAASDGRWQAKDLSDSLQKEWVRVKARTHVDMSPDKRLESAVELCDYLVRQLPLDEFELEIGGGGNWDDDAIEKISLRLGFQLEITAPTKTNVKRHVRDELGALKLVKNRRNRLAHGAISFVDCADGVTVEELQAITDSIGSYLREVIGAFTSYLDLFEYLRAESRPVSETECTA
jgi:hypothetical protein